MQHPTSYVHVLHLDAKARELSLAALLIAIEQLRRDAELVRDFAPRDRRDALARELEDKRRDMLELYTRVLNHDAA